MRLPLALAPILLGGCATIFTGTTDTLTFAANVPGVRVTIDGQYRGETPLTLPMSRNFMGGRQFIATFERNGYVTQEFKLNREFNTVAILDVTSLPTSVGVDLLTGSLLRFSPTDYHVQMLKAGQSAASPEFQRSTSLYRHALANHRSLQKDIARGGGEVLSSFAAALGGDGRETAALICEEAVRNGPHLVAATGPHDFIGRFDHMLEVSPALRGHRM
jgi:hypothetical protein